jgi:hypothetical protein
MIEQRIGASVARCLDEGEPAEQAARGRAAVSSPSCFRTRVVS